MNFQEWLYPSPTTLALPPPLLVVGKRSIGKTHLINGMLKKNSELKHCDLYGNYPPESYKAGHIYEATAVPDDYVGAVLTMTLSYRRANS